MWLSWLLGSYTITDKSQKHGQFALCPFCNNKAVVLGDGRYEIVKRVGEGNFSAVFLAKDRWSSSSSLEEPVVALKIFHSQYEDVGRAVSNRSACNILNHFLLVGGRVLKETEKGGSFWSFWLAPILPCLST